MSHETMPLKELPIAVNFRDVADLDPTKLKPGRVFRSSELFKEEVLSLHKIKSLVDMRNPGSGPETHPVYVALEDDAKSVADDDVIRITCIDMIKRPVKFTLLSRMPRRIWWKIFKCLYNGMSPARVMCPAVCDPECLGLKEFYKILVDKAGDSIAEILRVFVDESNYPVMFHCTHGKDRTGIISCILGLIANISDEAICQDYVLSGLQLQAAKAMYKLPLEDHLLDDLVISAPYEVVDSLIKHFNEKYDGIEGYLHSIGITDSDCRSIRHNILQQP